MKSELSWENRIHEKKKIRDIQEAPDGLVGPNRDSLGGNHGSVRECITCCYLSLQLPLAAHQFNCIVN